MIFDLLRNFLFGSDEVKVLLQVTCLTLFQKSDDTSKVYKSAVKNEWILVIFGIRNMEEMSSHQMVMNYTPHL